MAHFDGYKTNLVFTITPSSNMLPTKSLCIQPGKFVWVLYVDATCINYNGNVFDATLLAMVSALKNGPYFCMRNP